MYIYIEALTGLKIRLNLSPQDTVHNIKYKIMVSEDLPVDEQHLIFQDQELENYKTLKFYRIPPDATLKLIMKMKGGPLSLDVDYEDILTEASPNNLIDQLAIIFLENGELRLFPISGLEMQNKSIKQTKDDLNDPSIFSTFEEPITDQKLVILKLKMDCIRLSKKLSNMSWQQNNSKVMQINTDNQSKINKSTNSILHRSISLDSRPTEFIRETSSCNNKFKSNQSTNYSSQIQPPGIFRTMSALDNIKLNKCPVSPFPLIKAVKKFNQKPRIIETQLPDSSNKANCIETCSRLPPLNESELENKRIQSKKQRCPVCSKRMSLINEFICRCGGHFCSKHKYPEEHNCKFDFKYNGRLELIKSNPIIESSKIAKI